MSNRAQEKDSAVLRLHDVHASYGAVRALHGVSMEVKEGSVVALLGANGAGKSTTLRVISGLLAPTAGRVEYHGDDVTGCRPASLVRSGLVHVPEGRQLFDELSVEENLKVGAYTQPWRSDLRAILERAYALFPVLGERRNQRAATLSGGEQQMLAIARALAADPQVLLLDEASLGLAPMVVEDIYQIIESLNKERGVTILLVEQNASLALEVADFAYVLETGTIAVSGKADELRDNEDVRRIYLGY